MKPHYLMDTNVVVLKLFPGIQENVVAAILGIQGLKAVVLETYGPAMLTEKNGLYNDFARLVHKEL
ncbi:hypothetical protein [Bacteroides sp.]|uniref:hypothetical protein n=1 Tax=Bacteroides sp. TaxID=29523 RepID=UPI002635991A|nr:hypothetical protein [Bacteroides sp.]